MNTVVLRFALLITLAGTILVGENAYAQRDKSTRPVLLLKTRTPVVKLPLELAAPDKATLQARSNQIDAARKIVAAGTVVPRTRPANPIFKFLDPKKPLPTPTTNPWSVELTPSNLKTADAYLEFTSPDATTATTAHFVQKRSAILGTADGFFYPDSFASFGFAAKKDHGYLITVKAKKLSMPIGKFVLFPLADGLGGGTMITQDPQVVALEPGDQDVLVERVVLISKDGWYGYRIGLLAQGEWELYSVSIKEIDSLLPD